MKLSYIFQITPSFANDPSQVLTVTPSKDELSMAVSILWYENEASAPSDLDRAIARVHSPSYRYPRNMLSGLIRVNSSQITAWR